MSKSSASDATLDSEFRQILHAIRRHIPQINSNSYLLQYRLWLEKLSNTSGDKSLRNIYLRELCEQIQAGELSPPFNQQPPKGNQLRKLASSKVQHRNAEFDHEMCCGDPVNTSASHLDRTKESKTSVLEDDESWYDLSDDSIDSDLNNASSKCLAKTKTSLLDKTHLIEKNDLVLEMKLTNTEAGYLSQDWKKTIGSLQLRLSEMIHQNRELNLFVRELKSQLQEEKLKNIAENEHRIKLSENIISDRLTQLEVKHAEQLTKTEEYYQKKIDILLQTHEDELKQVSNNYEQKIMESEKEYKDELEKKDDEITRLSGILQNQCLRVMNDIANLRNQVSNCTCDKKVHILKKCVSKMDKLFQKSEQDYIREISHLKQELELKETALQMQLKIQKAELIAQTRTGQKEEFEEILNTLEVKYIKMLEGHELQVTNMKQKDDARIQYLCDLLTEHGIYYE